VHTRPRWIFVIIILIRPSYHENRVEAVDTLNCVSQFLWCYHVSLVFPQYISTFCRLNGRRRHGSRRRWLIYDVRSLQYYIIMVATVILLLLLYCIVKWREMEWKIIIITIITPSTPRQTVMYTYIYIFRYEYTTQTVKAANSIIYI